mmetsp:Transcript_155/g.415  ORF Transcript_155/g.415 Transcript_155/m.415 type:complete len:478 (+) Transcript_155:216-1649(+)
MAMSQSQHIYRIGDIALPGDIDSSSAADAEADRASHHLKQGDGAFVRRSDRIWRYATVQEAHSQHIVFKVEENGSTKKVVRHHFADRIRPHLLTKTNAQYRRDLVAGKKVGVFSSWRSVDETTPECESQGSSCNSLNQSDFTIGKDFSDTPYSKQSNRSMTQLTATYVPLSTRGPSEGPCATSSASERNESTQVDPLVDPLDICGSAAEMKKSSTNVTRRRRFSLRRADSNAAGIHYLDEKEVLSDEGSERVDAGSKPRATARRRGSLAKLASKVARRLSNGKKNRAAADGIDSQGGVSVTAAAIEEVKKWDEQEAKGSVSPKQPPTNASRRRGSITNRASQALRRMPHDNSRVKNSRRPTKHESKRTFNHTTSGIFKSLMAGDLGKEDCTSEPKQPCRSNNGKRGPGTGSLSTQDAAEMPTSAPSRIGQSRRGRPVTVPNVGAREGVRKELSSSVLFKRGIANLMIEKKRASCPNL